MAHKFLARCKFSVSGTPGTGNFTVGAAVDTFRTPAGAGAADADTFPYYAEEPGVGWETGVATYTASGTVVARSVSESSNSNNAVNFGSGVIVASAPLRAELEAFLRSDLTALITKGFTVSPYSLGSKNSGWTIDPALGNYQYMTNGGAHTITAPSTDCAVDILVINGASGAGALSFSGFKTPGSGANGATYATTANTWWWLSVRRVNGVSSYSWNGPWT